MGEEGEGVTAAREGITRIGLAPGPNLQLPGRGNETRKYLHVKTKFIITTILLQPLFTLTNERL